MGNILGSKRTNKTKVIKITGETQVFKTPIQAEKILKNHPHHVLLQSEEVKILGTSAQPLELQQNLLPERLYFLVDIPDNWYYSKRVLDPATVSAAAARLERLKQRRWLHATAPAGDGAGHQKRVSFVAMKERGEKSNSLRLNAA